MTDNAMSKEKNVNMTNNVQQYTPQNTKVNIMNPTINQGEFM